MNVLDDILDDAKLSHVLIDRMQAECTSCHAKFECAPDDAMGIDTETGEAWYLCLKCRAKHEEMLDELAQWREPQHGDAV